MCVDSIPQGFYHCVPIGALFGCEDRYLSGLSWTEEPDMISREGLRRDKRRLVRRSVLDLREKEIVHVYLGKKIIFQTASRVRLDIRGGGHSSWFSLFTRRGDLHIDIILDPSGNSWTFAALISVAVRVFRG